MAQEAIQCLLFGGTVILFVLSFKGNQYCPQLLDMGVIGLAGVLVPIFSRVFLLKLCIPAPDLFWESRDSSFGLEVKI